MAKIGFIGLGNMGKGMCKNLIEAGHEATVYDASQEAMRRFEGKARLAHDVMEVYANSEYIWLSLPNSAVVESVVNQFLESGMKGKTVIDTSTSYPVSTRALYAKVKEQGGQYVDAPLMAGPDEAESGDLEVVVGGDKEYVESLEPFFEAYSKKHSYVGQIGNGHLAKVAINFCALTEALLLSEVYPLMAKFGFAPEELYNILNCEALDNWVFQFYSKKYIKQEYRLDFALSLGLKDLSYAKKLFDELNIPSFILDGALDLCRVTLKEQQEGETLDFSHPGRTMYEFVGLDRK